jgi:hypothetical protein
MSSDVVVRCVLIEVMEQSCDSPPIFVFAEVACECAHDTLDRDKVANGRVLLRVLLHHLSGFGLIHHSSTVNAFRRSSSASAAASAITSSPV